MTGFGSEEGETGLGKVSVEARSVNHRYSDINIKLPKRLLPLEGRVKEVVRSHVSRGRVDVSIRLDASGGERVKLQVDLPLAEQYVEALRSLKEKLNLKGEVSIELMTGVKDLITAKEENGDIEPYWQEILPILNQSLQKMDAMKRSEGEELARDLRTRLDRIFGGLKGIRERFPLQFQAYQDRLRDRLRSMLAEIEIDPYRIQQEIAFLAERTDITEELVRAESHLRQFDQLLKSEEQVGRKMDFLLQEIHREFNTMSAKVNDAQISQKVVEIKSELEKIREQVQNME